MAPPAEIFRSKAQFYCFLFHKSISAFRFLHLLRDCNLQNEQCFTGTAIRPESPHIDRVCRDFFTKYVCGRFVQELEIVANQIKIDGVGVA